MANELERVNNSEPITPTFKFKVDRHSLISRFGTCFKDLNQIVRRNLRPNESIIPSSPIATTPTQTLFPPNIPLTPQIQMNSEFTSPASTKSGASEKAEHFSNEFVLDFLKATLESLNDDIESMAWYGDQGQLYTRSSTFKNITDQQLGTKDDNKIRPNKNHSKK